MFKLELSKKLPFIRERTSACLRNPWLNQFACTFEKLTRQIEFLCLVENVSPLAVDWRLFGGSRERKAKAYRLFCWIIYAVNYLEHCQAHLLIDPATCSLNSIELIVKLVIKECNSTLLLANSNIEQSSFSAITEHYCERFNERSMQILVQILVLFESNYDQLTSIALEKFKLYGRLGAYKLNILGLLNYLLNEYAVQVLRSYPVAHFIGNQERYELKNFVKKAKIAQIFEYSQSFILKHVLDLIKRLRS